MGPEAALRVDKNSSRFIESFPFFSLTWTVGPSHCGQPASLACTATRPSTRSSRSLECASLARRRGRVLRTEGTRRRTYIPSRRCDPPSGPHRKTVSPASASSFRLLQCGRDSPRSADDDRQTVLLPNLDMSPHAGDKSGLPRRPHTPGEAADADCATTQRSPTSVNACASEVSPPNTRFGRTSTHIPCASMLHAYRPGGFFALPDLRSIRPDATTRPIINSTLAVRARNVGLYSLPFPANRDHDRPLSRLSFHCER